LGLGPGSMGGTGSMGTWIIGTIRGTDTAGRRRLGAIGRSITFRAMRRGMGRGIPARPGIVRRRSIVPGLSVAGAGAVVAAAEAAGIRARRIDL
jgi:hypothetical protein